LIISFEFVESGGHGAVLLEPSKGVFDFPKWSAVYAYFAKWNAPRDGGSLLEQALKTSGWRGPRATGSQRMQRVLDRGRASA